MSALVLLVEDDDNDVLLMQRAFRKAAVPAELEIVRDGATAQARLAACAHRAPRPNVVLLDNRLPRMSGLELLAWKREQPGLASIPVVMVSSSDRPEDISQAWALGVASYVTKPSETAERQRLVEGLVHWWLGVNVTG